MSNPVANCAAKNTNNAGIMNYGMRLLTDTQVDYAVGREAGIEIQAPAGEKIAQVQFDARAAQGVQGAQDGISGTGSRLVREFVGGANPEHGSLVPGNTSISPLRLCQRVAGFPVSSR